VEAVEIAFDKKLVMAQASENVTDEQLTQAFEGTRFSAEVVAN
jgi:hypothetical protein